MKPFPAVVVTKFKMAAAQPKERRLRAIDESVKWAKKYFPEYFRPATVADLPAIGMPTLTNYIKQLKSLTFKELK